MFRRVLPVLGLLLFLAASPVSGDSIEEVTGTGLYIQSNPTGAKVYIDGISRGTTPLTMSDLSPGRYSLRLEREGYLDRQVRISVPENGRVRVSLDLERATGRLWVTVQRAAGSPDSNILPFNPAVYVDGSLMTGSILTLPEGFRSVRVRAFGWEDASRTVYITAGAMETADFVLRPAAFRISGLAVSRQRFNPGNSGNLGTTEFSFEASSSGQGTLVISNAAGETVYYQYIGPFRTWSQTVIWDGRGRGGTPLPDGVYYARLETESLPWDGSKPAERSASAAVTIDSSIQIYPRSLFSGKPGFLFSPVPDQLPKGSYQFDAGLLFGRPEPSRGAWTSLPFALAFRFSPMDRLEIAAALNVDPEFEGDAATAFAGSVKWRFFGGGGEPFGLALGAAYGWSWKGEVSPFGLVSGPEVFVPLSWTFPVPITVVLSPGLAWPGERGRPDEGIPRGIVSGGVGYRHRIFAAGISAKTDFAFAGDSPVSLEQFSAGAEFKFFPPPSTFVFSVLGGVCLRDSEWGPFGGVGIGLIY
ncbi:PEGA domain-containing protein [Breznakiella homolactica]|uniref:PEGA domain-containing protein n=1 Tax=Breznakiella homolactica TaxID=2798577 RepID=A0A7T7XME0_9SPIR|nr:PEGA domain-containing protein [Breznakiella homolactica]QQO09039.1 PEGA domain-containing protein [Breznakiella homolactica]